MDDDVDHCQMRDRTAQRVNEVGQSAVWYNDEVQIYRRGGAGRSLEATLSLEDARGGYELDPDVALAGDTVVVAAHLGLAETQKEVTLVFEHTGAAWSHA